VCCDADPLLAVCRAAEAERQIQHAEGHEYLSLMMSLIFASAWPFRPVI